MRADRTRKHLPALDGLRGLAALGVFFVHFGQIVPLNARLGPFDLSTLRANGTHSVALFFILSGFLLGLPLWQNLATGAPLPRLGAYAVRRLARIVPLYYFVLALLVLPSGLWRAPGFYADLLLHCTFLHNFTEFSTFSLNPPFWTLAVEMQFYVLLPMLLVLLRRRTPGQALAVLLALGLGAYAAHAALVRSVERVIAWPWVPWLTWIRPGGAVLTHSLLAHLPHFLLGLAAGRLFLRLDAYASDSPQAVTVQRWSEAAFWVGLAVTLVLLATGWVEHVQVPHGRYGLPVVPVLLTGLILAAPHARAARACLDAFPLRWLGVMSYSFYLCHLPCLNLLDRGMLRLGLDAPRHGLLFGGAGLALSVVIAALLYAAIERPVLRLANKVSSGTGRCPAGR